MTTHVDEYVQLMNTLRGGLAERIARAIAGDDVTTVDENGMRTVRISKTATRTIDINELCQFILEQVIVARASTAAADLARLAWLQRETDVLRNAFEDLLRSRDVLHARNIVLEEGHRLAEMERGLEELDELAHTAITELSRCAVGSLEFRDGYERGMVTLGCAVRKKVVQIDPGLHDRIANRQREEKGDQRVTPSSDAASCATGAP